MTKRILGVVVVFGLGVGIGCGAAPLIVPKASAQQAQLTKWEYLCKERPSIDDATPDANRLAAEAWEMVAVSERGWCWKRPKM